MFIDDDAATARLANQTGLYFRGLARYATLGELAEARSCYEQALQVFQKFFGANHPYTVGVGNSLEELKREMR